MASPEPSWALFPPSGHPSPRLKSQSLGHLSLPLSVGLLPGVQLSPSFHMFPWPFSSPHFVFSPLFILSHYAESGQIEPGRDEWSSSPASGLPVVSKAVEEETDSLLTRAGGSLDFSGLSKRNKRGEQIMVDWWKPVSSFPFLCLKQAPSHLVAEGVISLAVYLPHQWCAVY